MSDEAVLARQISDLTNAQNKTAVATLAAAIIQARKVAGIEQMMDAVRDAEHILMPRRELPAYHAWRERHSLGKG